jgi:hypothetical protein
MVMRLISTLLAEQGNNVVAGRERMGKHQTASLNWPFDAMFTLFRNWLVKH